MSTPLSDSQLVTSDDAGDEPLTDAFFNWMMDPTEHQMFSIIKVYPSQGNKRAEAHVVPVGIFWGEKSIEGMTDEEFEDAEMIDIVDQEDLEYLPRVPSIILDLVDDMEPGSVVMLPHQKDEEATRQVIMGMLIQEDIERNACFFLYRLSDFEILLENTDTLLDSLDYDPCEPELASEIQAAYVYFHSLNEERKRPLWSFAKEHPVETLAVTLDFLARFVEKGVHGDKKWVPQHASKKRSNKNKRR